MFVEICLSRKAGGTSKWRLTICSFACTLCRTKNREVFQHFLEFFHNRDKRFVLAAAFLPFFTFENLRLTIFGIFSRAKLPLISRRY